LLPTDVSSKPPDCLEMIIQDKTLTEMDAACSGFFQKIKGQMNGRFEFK